VRFEVIRKKLTIKTSLRNSRSICRATILKDNESGSRKVSIARVVPADRKPLQYRVRDFLLRAISLKVGRSRMHV